MCRGYTSDGGVRKGILKITSVHDETDGCRALEGSDEGKVGLKFSCGAELEEASAGSDNSLSTE